MAQKDSRRLFMVLPYLYPNLERDKDWRLYNNSDGKGTQLVWLNKDITSPTDKELLDAKEGGLIQYWWIVLRSTRDKLLIASDKYALPDRPDRDKWIAYRKKLRDLPTTVKPPSFEVLNNDTIRENRFKIADLMPTKP
jgi:hypothetical protein|tara:strand:+ start:871 stop:1284 length:414 start_codon:yes stop_codon:yes gene_type:complete